MRFGHTVVCGSELRQARSGVDAYGQERAREKLAAD